MPKTPASYHPIPLEEPEQLSSEEAQLVNSNANNASANGSGSVSATTSASASVILSVEDDDDEEEEEENSDLSMTSSMGATKRRLGCPPLAPKAHSSPPPLPLPPALSLVAGRRRRLFAYLAAFAIMLALSSVLDLRRAAVSAKKSEKITLSLPGATAPTTDTTTPADGAAIADAAVNTGTGTTHSKIASQTLTNAGVVESHTHTQNTIPTLNSATTANSASGTTSTGGSTTGSTTASGTGPTAIPGSKLSDQELKDDVDQLISHVEQEASANTTATNTGTNTASDNTQIPASTTSSSDPTPSDVHAKYPNTHEKQGDDAGNRATQPGVQVLHDGSVSNSGVVTGTVPVVAVKNETTASDEGATIEEQFTAAQTAMDGLPSNETLRPLLESRTEELRTLKALALQSTRGDCEKAAEPAAGSLFKTDAEASGADIEKADPLWGAWCAYSGRYRSDAMRQYLAQTRVFRAVLETELEKRASGATTPDDTPRFDDMAATLDDVLTPDAQALLRAKATAILPHLSDADARLLAALSLQATLGDCAPYALKSEHARTNALKGQSDDQNGSKQPPRSLIDPLFGRQATRGEGVLWGAWCVFANQKRATIAAKLTDRVDEFWKQLNDAAAAPNTNYA